MMTLRLPGRIRLAGTAMSRALMLRAKVPVRWDGCPGWYGDLRKAAQKFDGGTER